MRTLLFFLAGAGTGAIVTLIYWKIYFRIKYGKGKDEE